MIMPDHECCYDYEYDYDYEYEYGYTQGVEECILVILLDGDWSGLRVHPSEAGP